MTESKSVPMNINNNFNEDLESYLRETGFSEHKIQLLLQFSSRVPLHRFVEVLFEEGLEFVKTNPSEWLKYPSYPAILYFKDDANLKEKKFLKNSTYSFSNKLPQSVFALPDMRLIKFARDRNWFSLLTGIYGLTGNLFIFLLVVLLAERVASFFLALQFQSILQLLNLEKPSAVLSLILSWALLRLVLMISSSVTGYLEFKLLSNLKYSCLPGVLAGLLNKKAKISDDPTGQVFVAIDSLGESISTAFTFSLKLPLQILSLLVFIGYLFLHDFRLALLVFVFFGLSALIKNFSGRKQSLLRENNLEQSKKFMSTMSSLVTNFGVVISHGVQTWASRLWSVDLDGIAKSKNKLLWYGQVFDFLKNAVTHSIFFTTFYLVSGPWKVSGDDFALAGTLSLIVSFTFSSLETVTDSIVKVWDLNAYLKFLPPTPGDITIGKDQAITPKNNIYFALKNADFFYGKNLVLKDVNLEMPRKAVVALSGENGTGKTTIIKALSSALELSSGQIFSDFLAGEVICISKSDRLFPGTLEDNLFLGEEYSEDEVYKVISLVSMMDWLDDHPLGLKTVIGEKGIGISGGENVRLLIARALLRRPKVLILDEATASLDLDTERSILIQLKKFLLGLELIVIVSHRKETLSLADHVFLLTNKSVIRYENS